MAVLWLSKSDTIDPDGEFTQAAVDLASRILFQATGEKYTGISTSTDAYQDQYNASVQLQPVVVYGDVINVPRFPTGVRNLRLRSTPVLSVISITRNGVVMDSTAYTLRNNAYIVQTNGVPWVLDSRDLMITYRHGTPIPPSGKRVATRLANELIHSWKDDGLCSLPERVQSVTRQGMSFAILDPQEFIHNGKVGIVEVDYFIQAVNPDKARKKSKVFSVDKPRGERIN